MVINILQYIYFLSIAFRYFQNLLLLFNLTPYQLSKCILYFYNTIFIVFILYVLYIMILFILNIFSLFDIISVVPLFVIQKIDGISIMY